MKKWVRFFILFLFVLFNIFCFDVNFFYNESSASGYEYSYTIFCDEKIYCFKDIDFKLNFSKLQKKNYHNIELINKLKDLNFSEEEILRYLFPEINEILKRLTKIYNKNEVPDKVFVKENKCELEFVSGKKGKTINRQKFYNDCLNQIENKNKDIKINLEIIDYKDSENIKNLFCEKSCFLKKRAPVGCPFRLNFSQ